MSLARALLGFVMLGLAFATTPGAAPPATVQITLASHAVSGTIALAVAVTGPDRPVAVQYLLDGYPIEAPATTGPAYEAPWSTALASPGWHLLSAEARFGSGTTVTSAPAQVMVERPPAARTLHVDAEKGHDSDPGTPNRPWKTLDRMTRALQPGDTAVLRGTFADQWLRILRGGTADRPITIRAVQDGAARITGGRYGAGIVLERGAAYVVIEGLGVSHAGIGLQLSGVHHVALRNLDVTDNAKGCVLFLHVDDSVLERSHIARCGDVSRNAGEGVQITVGRRNRVVHNHVADGGHSAVILLGTPNIDGETVDTVVAHNVIANSWATGFGMTGWKVERALVEHNVIRDSGTAGLVNCRLPDGSRGPCPGGGPAVRPGIQTQGSTSVIRYNVIANNSGSGIEIGAYPYGNVKQEPRGNQVYNNTFYGNGGAGLYVFEKRGARVTETLIANNIFYRNGGAPPGPAGGSYTWLIDQYHTPAEYFWPEGSLNGNRITNNLVLREPGRTGELAVGRTRSAELRGGWLSYTLRDFERRYGEATGNFKADPGFVDEAGGNFHLRPDSPALGRAIEVPGAPGSGAFVGALGVEPTGR
ncbi:MAG: right-handed parallel beta-helix repeat-containing protein [Candidatus Rokubacteria bacterium]|nr:right-handed parallel beta-helix repeat-containing protein [Candidatus Rokubacteria bacterium]